MESPRIDVAYIARLAKLELSEEETALLTEDEASRMHHLLGSTDVYLRDLYLAEQYPSWAVNIVNSECEYKKNDAGVWGAQYTITVEFSQQITRQ